MRVLLAFDKFKDALTAQQACEFAAGALRERHPDWTLDLCPLADGGEGFCEILTRAAGGAMIRAAVSGPRGAAIAAEYGIVSGAKIPAAAAAFFGGKKPPGRIAVIELAAASGLALLAPSDRDPGQTTTLGTGELIRAAAGESGADAILLGVGGSATSDLGTGALAALGLQFLSADGAPVHPPVPARWHEIARIAGEVLGLPPVFIACDVTNPLLGPRGAAAVFGPQKGLRPADLTRLENESARIALMLCGHCRQPDSLMDAAGAGAAGGTPFGLMVAARAAVLPGAGLVSAWLDLDLRLAAAELVITGEGRFDESSLHGKGPGAIAACARAFGLPVHVFAGEVNLAASAGGPALHRITPPGTPLSSALRDAGANLAAAVRAAF